MEPGHGGPKGLWWLAPALLVAGFTAAVPASDVPAPLGDGVASMSNERAVAPAPNWERRLETAARVTCSALSVERDVFCRPLLAERRQLIPRIAYYTLRLQVGPGEHDVIAVHRVVAERKVGHPMAGNKAVLMIHGDIWGFEPAFLGLTAYAVPRRTSFPVFLAQNGVDVWGISFRWAQVPVASPDTSFMAPWGLDTALSDARLALRVARVARRLAGDGNEKLQVIGWSRGVWTTMALANAEAAEPSHRRDIAGLIPVDGAFKLGVESDAWRQFLCGSRDYYQGLMDAGVFGDDDSLFHVLGQLAIEAPEGPSPIVAGLTNFQAALGIGSWPVGIPGMEWYHFASGLFDDQGIPTGLAYTPPSLFVIELTKGFGYDPIHYERDTSAISCDDTDVPWDDHLARVRVPVFYVGAAGGFGANGAHLTEVVGSKDVKTLIVRTRPPEEAAFDIGHVDIFQAPASRDLFWKPILAWIKAH